MQTSHQIRQERSALVQWAANDNYTHAFTLNTDRELSINRLRSILSTFCHRFDKRVHGTRNLRRVPVDARLRLIAFSENLTTNAHLHGVADFSLALGVFGTEWRLTEEIRRMWLKSTHGSGSVNLEKLRDQRWLTYCTKRYNGTCFLAADFHPH